MKTEQLKLSESDTKPQIQPNNLIKKENSDAGFEKTALTSLSIFFKKRK